jgi:predicted DNA-binding transcriptional regulator YafY
LLWSVSRPTTRVLELLELLQDRQRASGPELADRLGVDLRTVRRYVAKLEELGIPVEATRGRSGGYRLRPGYKLPPLMPTDEEAVAVVLGLLAARRDGLATAAPAVDGALTKVRRVLPVELRERVRALEGALGFSARAGFGHAAPGPQQVPPQTATVLALAGAIGREKRVEVVYRTRDGARSRRQLDPYGLVFHHGRWYLSARDHGRDALRTLRLDRIGAVRELRRDAPPPPGFDPVAEVARALARVPWRWEVEVLLDAPLEALRAQVPPHAAELEQTADGVLLRARAERLDGMARLLAGLGAPLTVVRPPQLRDELARLAARLAAA